MSAAAASAATGPRLSLSVAEIDHPEFRAGGVHLEHALDGRAQLTIGRLILKDRQVRELRLECRGLRLRQGRLVCKDGALSSAEPAQALRLAADIDLGKVQGSAEIRGAAGARIRLQVHDRQRADIRIDRLGWSHLQPWIDMPDGWSVDGELSGSVGWQPAQLDFRVSLNGAAFSNREGTRAGEQLALEAAGHRRMTPAGEEGQAEVRWRQGAVYWQPFLLAAGPVADLRWQRANHGGTDFELRLAGEGFESIEASGHGEANGAVPERLRIRAEGANLAALGPRFIAPWLDPASPESWQLAGHASGALEFRAGELTALDARLSRVSFNNDPRGWRLGPVSGTVGWQSMGKAQTRLRFEAAGWRKLEFGAFELAFESRGSDFELENLRLPLLDGALVIENAALALGQDDPQARASAFIEPLSMRRLSAALGWPAMSGLLSASVPTLRYAQRELNMDGALVVGVFDGYVQATGLRAIDPFGPVPRLQAGLEVHALDLGLLTEAFSFGDISGRVDAVVDGLELIGWKPVRFDAHVLSSPGDYSRRISQRAVQNIGALGGAGAATAIQRSLLRLFDTFGYRRLGFSCRLRGGVCELDGLAGGRRDGGFVIVEGGGVPALNVIGYNRRVDWDELIERVQAVIESNAAPVVR